jgi:hypothetical protein
MINRLLIGTTFALLVHAGIAATALADDKPEPAKHPCIFVKDIDNYRDVDARTAIISTSPSKKFKVTFADRCDQMRFSSDARIVSNPGVCLSRGDRMVFGHRDGFRDICWIESIEQLPPEASQTPAAN